MSSRLQEIQKTERLKALYDARKDVYGENKALYVYEILKFNIRQRNRTITKKYYNLIHKEYYTFTSQYDEVILYQHVRNRLSKRTPFQLEIQLKKDSEKDALIEYYNEQSQKYFDMVYMNGDYIRKKTTLDILRHRNTDNINDLIDFMMNLSFDI